MLLSLRMYKAMVHGYVKCNHGTINVMCHFASEIKLPPSTLKKVCCIVIRRIKIGNYFILFGICGEKHPLIILLLRNFPRDINRDSSSFVLWYQNLTTFVTLAKSEFFGNSSAEF